MGQPNPPPPARLILAAFSRYDEALDWARDRAVCHFGARAMESPRFAFDNTDYYRATMGEGLKKTFWLFERPFDPEELVGAKLLTNRWEEEYAVASNWPETRPLNLDPGYLTLGKLVLASTKDFAHRVYLGRGIFAEITLYFEHHHWQHHRFTFPDYRREDYQVFFTACRNWLHSAIEREDAR